MKFNTRIHPPNEATSSSEAAIKVQEDAIRCCIIKYISDTTQDTILSDKEGIGKESIRKRIAEGEVLLTFTDKDGHSVLCSPSIYQEAAKVHTGKDAVVSWDTLAPIIQTINRTAKALVFMFKVGQGGSSSQRERRYQKL